MSRKYSTKLKIMINKSVAIFLYHVISLFRSANSHPSFICPFMHLMEPTVLLTFKASVLQNAFLVENILCILVCANVAALGWNNAGSA